MSKLKYLLLLLAFFLPVRAKAAGSFVQSCNVITGAVGSCTLHGVVSGHTAVLLYFTCGNRGSIPGTFSDTFATTFVEVNASFVNGNCVFRNTTLELDYGTFTQNGDDTLTVNVSGNIAGIGVIFAEYSGVTVPIVEDPVGGSINSSNGTTATSGNIVTTVAGDLLLSGGAVVVTGTQTMTATNGFTIHAFLAFPAGAFPAVNVYLSDRTAVTPGTYAGTWNVSSAGDYYAVIGSLECELSSACSNALVVKGFGMTIPGTATITGISVKLGGHQTNFDATSLNYIMLRRPDNTFCPTTHTVQLPVADGTLVEVGGQFDTWGGCALTPAIVNDPNFRVYIVSKTSSLSPAEFYIYDTRLKVWY